MGRRKEGRRERSREGERKKEVQGGKSEIKNRITVKYQDDLKETTLFLLQNNI